MEPRRLERSDKKKLVVRKNTWRERSCLRSVGLGMGISARTETLAVFV